MDLGGPEREVEECEGVCVKGADADGPGGGSVEGYEDEGEEDQTVACVDGGESGWTVGGGRCWCSSG